MGDANTEYFHKCANGRRKTKIVSLETDNVIITEQKDICDHIVGFYKQLFDSSGDNNIHLASDFWSVEDQLGGG
jgi:hypothetical protein